MDKEAQEKIAEILSQPIKIDLLGARARGFKGIEKKPNARVSQILQALRQLGYRKLPKDKPPLLSDEKLNALWRCEKGLPEWATWEVPKWFAKQAQREADIKHYEGG